jgi:hypothetical protein
MDALTGAQIHKLKAEAQRMKTTHREEGSSGTTSHALKRECPFLDALAVRRSDEATK